ncbi:2-methylaconitate cis-trans isomerase PrpF family protein [Pelagibacterium montanilacus]|uniref:2-methylaconitate cis-trans isomerase PrpF family protein n=1 Tax=Pelagibacterium montanilacus TaxID=2185280 RepID=UPI000F8D61D9|nr:PrpF domain-containing protein [Pelagibacterium montanilacus]
MQDRLKCTIMRGGTSRGVFLDGAALPQDIKARESVILRVFGSPDRRQIDGLGGADPLTSKLAIIDRPDEELRETSDLVYTFGQVGIAHAEVDWHSLCGNITAAVGVYAIQEGFVEPRAPVTTVRVYNTNLHRHLLVDVPVSGGAVVSQGDYAVPGVPGTGARIDIDFSQTAGAAVGDLLPTGNRVDVLDIEGLGAVEVSLLDIGNAHVFVRAADVGMKGTESAAEIDRDPELLARLELIRGAAAVRLGMTTGTPVEARDQSPAVPILGVISSPADYISALDGKAVSAADVDVVSRLQFMQQTHKTYAGTSTACTGVAARVSGTIVHQMARPTNGRIFRIGHPAGVIETQAEVEESGGELIVRRATLGRTARRILDGTVYL